MSTPPLSLGQRIDALGAVIAARRAAPADQSYTAALLAAGPQRCAKKLGEEAVEAVIAAVSGDRETLAQEAADLIYHLLVTLEACDTPAEAVAAALAAREGTSGHAEKAARGKPGSV